MPRGVYIRRPITEERRKQMSIRMIGNRYAIGNQGNKIFTTEHKQKISIAKKGTHVGEKHPNWKGGVTPKMRLLRHSIEYRLWRESVFARDHWNCQNCGKISNLHAHHIKSFTYYPELRFAIDNGLTLCRECHRETYPGRGKKCQN